MWASAEVAQNSPHVLGPSAGAAVPTRVSLFGTTNGSLASLVALIEKQIVELAKDSVDFKLYFSGGDAVLLAEMINFDKFEIVTGLVLDGLALACPQFADDKK